MNIDADLDGGSIRVLDATDPADVTLALRPDSAADILQWFCFRATGAEGEDLGVRIVNAGDATFPDAWEGYRTCASYDGERWFRVDTAFDGEELSFQHTPEAGAVVYALFAPYSWERHKQLITRSRRAKRARVVTLAQSVERRPVQAVVAGEPGPGKRTIWITARQHPGETMAEWFMEGLLGRLLDPSDDLGRRLLDKAVFHLVPNMNPDGGIHGNQRTNAAGKNLNREWHKPDPKTSPEVWGARKAILASGADLFLDIHGDESTPYVFAAGCEGNPGYSPRIEALEDLFMQSLVQLDDDFQREHGYELDPPGGADMGIAANQIGEALDCLALTLEMPYKDDDNNPDEEAGWSPQRAMGFGRTVLEAIFVSLDELR
jgi:murein tripeptide amidase MpaA